MPRYFLIAYFGLGLAFPAQVDFHAHLGALLLWCAALACLAVTHFLVDKHHRMTVNFFAKALAESLVALLTAEGKEWIAAGETADAAE